MFAHAIGARWQSREIAVEEPRAAQTPVREKLVMPQRKNRKRKSEFVNSPLPPVRAMYIFSVES